MPSEFAEYTTRLTRELIHTLVSERDDAQLAEHIGWLGEQLTAAAADPGAVRVLDPAPAPPSHLPNDITPASSPINPIAPPMHIVLDGEVSRCELTLPLQYQGPPGRVHGGIVATLLDHVLGHASNAGQAPRAFTRYLTINYEAATPIGEPLVVTGWVDRTEGRKRFMVGEISYNGEVRARAEGLWIEPRTPRQYD